MLQVGEVQIVNRSGPPTLVDMTVESLFPRLEPLLPRVAKPIQYVGGECNAVLKDWDSVAVHWALMSDQLVT